MTDEILATVVQKNKMYVKWKSTPITHVDYLAIKHNFKTYDKIVRRSIEVEKKRYFERRFETYKNNMKKTWITIGESLNRHKKKSDLSLSFIHNNRELTIPTDIANAFNSYFAAIGRNIAAALDSDHIKDQTYSTYLNTPHRSEWQFECVSEFEIIIAINNLENKSSMVSQIKFYTNANMLIRKFFKCSVDVKCYLFKTYCSTMYCSAMWFDTTKSAMKKLKVAYNNSLRRLLSLPTYNSASEMFAVLNIPSFGELLRKFAFSFMSRMSSSINVFMVNIYNSSVPLFSKLWGWWYSILTI